MAATTVNNAPAGKELPGAPSSFLSSPGLVADIMAVTAAVLVAVLFFFFYPDTAERLYQALGYGWAPVGLWGASALLALRYRHRFLLRYWRYWAAAAALAAASIGALSYFAPSDGLLEDVSLGGRWGQAVGGPALLPYGALKMAAIIALLPVALYPRIVAPLYRRGAVGTGRGIAAGASHLYRGARPASASLGRGIGRFNQSLARRRAEKAAARAARRPVNPGPVDPGDAPANPSDLPPYLRQTPDHTPAAYPADAPVNFGDARGHRPTDAPTVTPPRDFGDFDWSLLEQEPQPAADPVPDAAADGWNRAAAATEIVYDNGYLPPWLQPSPAASAPETGGSWRLPPPEMLAAPEAESRSGAGQDALRDMGRLVEETLADHGVRVEVTDVKAGPRVVQFGLSPGWTAKGKDGGGERSRVKVQSIITREKDLALALKTPYLRMEAPMLGNGAGLVGIEVPTPSPSKVHLRAVMETADFRKIESKGGLPIAMGQDTGGGAVALDLAALPHMLIAGSTGSGKSVQINSIIASFLLTRTPEQLRLLMVDPKRVELTPFNGIPHLIQPVIVEADEVTDALRGLNREMIRRYKQMEELGVRNIDGYNRKADEKMPFLVLIVDELADLMMAAGFEVEQNLVRLAQLGRAAGIHLLLATQRPSVNVVTGLLKANIPARCAFAVSGQVDSRVILDAAGAEKLMGKGDALILHKESPKAQRMQGALVYDEEVESLVKFWQDQDGPPVPTINLLSDESDPEAESLGLDTQQMDQARDLAARNPNLSSSVLERRLKVGGKRAAEILDTLEAEGYLTPR